MKTYNANDWYWVVAGSAAQVYSSKLSAYIPISHADYVAFVADGGHPTRIDTEQNLYDVLINAGQKAGGLSVVVVPQAVTMRQARLALLNAGLLASVNAAVLAATGAEGDAMRIEWEFSSEVHRSRPFVAAMGAALGLTSAQLDALFIAAEKL